MAYSRGRNYRTKGRKSRKRRMKKGRRGKKKGAARLKTQVSSLRRQVKKLIKSPAIVGTPIKKHTGMITRLHDISPSIAGGDPPWVSTAVSAPSGGYCMVEGGVYGRTFPEFRMLPFITSPDDIYPFVMKGQSIKMTKMSVSFDAIWPANYVNYWANSTIPTAVPTATGGAVVQSTKLNPDVEFLLVHYTSAAGLAQLLPDETMANVHMNDQEFEDAFVVNEAGEGVLHSNMPRYTYAGMSIGPGRAHKREGWEDVHIVDRKVVKFPQTKYGDMDEVVISGASKKTYLNPSVSRRVTLSVKYSKGKKIQLNPVPVTQIARSDPPVAGTPVSTQRLAAGHYADQSFSQLSNYWTAVARDDGFIVVARYAGRRPTAELNGVTLPDLQAHLAYGGNNTDASLGDYSGNPTLPSGRVSQLLGTIQWQNAKFSTEYYDC